MPPRLLLLLPSTSYRAAAFVEAARQLGITLTVGSDHASVFGKAQPDGLLALDFSRPDRFNDQVRTFAQRQPVAAVFGVDDDTAVLAARAAEALGLPHNSVDSCLAARDKHLQRTRLSGAGVAIPGFRLHRFDDDLAAVAKAVPYPCVVKPLRLSMSRGVIRADDPAAFLAAAARLRAILAEPDAAKACGDTAGSFLVEQFVPGREVALEGLLTDGALQVLTVFDKPDSLDGPYFEETIYATPTDLDPARQAQVAGCVQQAARAMGLTSGPVHAEVRINDAGAWLVELAARPIGGRCSAVLRFGERGEVSLEQLLLAQALGLPGFPPSRPPRLADAAAAVMMIPVPRDGTLVRVGGVDQARLVPWIDDVAVTVHPGDRLRPLPEGNRYLGFIFARAAAATTAVQAVREAHAKLTVELE